MRPVLNISPNFTLDDIRAIRRDMDERYFNPVTRKIDWDGYLAEVEEGAAEIRRELAERRARKDMAM